MTRVIDAPGRLIWAMVNRLNITGQSTALGAMNESGLTLPQVVVLDMLRRGPSRISSLADILHLSLSATSSLVQRLVEDELVTREEDVEDRRQKRVALTRKGSAVFERIDRERSEGVARGLAALPPALRGELVDVVKRVLEHLEGER
jgi:DNA-binding MarR family transcriptional regulator